MAKVQLVYTSRASFSVDVPALTEIGRTARAHNATEGISGALCYAFGKFLQVLEGSSLEVNKLYLKIAQDKRHEMIQLVGYSQIELPAFAMWSMKTVNLETADSPEAKYLIHHNNFGGFNPESWDMPKAVAFLQQMARTLP